MDCLFQIVVLMVVFLETLLFIDGKKATVVRGARKNYIERMTHKKLLEIDQRRKLAFKTTHYDSMLHKKQEKNSSLNHELPKLKAVRQGFSSHRVDKKNVFHDLLSRETGFSLDMILNPPSTHSPTNKTHTPILLNVFTKQENVGKKVKSLYSKPKLNGMRNYNNKKDKFSRIQYPSPRIDSYNFQQQPLQQRAFLYPQQAFANRQYVASSKEPVKSPNATRGLLYQRNIYTLPPASIYNAYSGKVYDDWRVATKSSLSNKNPSGSNAGFAKKPMSGVDVPKKPSSGTDRPIKPAYTIALKKCNNGRADCNQNRNILKNELSGNRIKAFHKRIPLPKSVIFPNNSSFHDWSVSASASPFFIRNNQYGKYLDSFFRKVARITHNKNFWDDIDVDKKKKLSHFALRNKKGASNSTFKKYFNCKWNNSCIHNKVNRIVNGTRKDFLFGIDEHMFDDEEPKAYGSPGYAVLGVPETPHFNGFEDFSSFGEGRRFTNHYSTQQVNGHISIASDLPVSVSDEPAATIDRPLPMSEDEIEAEQKNEISLGHMVPISRDEAQQESRRHGTRADEILIGKIVPDEKKNDRYDPFSDPSRFDSSEVQSNLPIVSHHPVLSTESNAMISPQMAGQDTPDAINNVIIRPHGMDQIDPASFLPATPYRKEGGHKYQIPAPFVAFHADAENDHEQSDNAEHVMRGPIQTPLSPHRANVDNHCSGNHDPCCCENSCNTLGPVHPCLEGSLDSEFHPNYDNYVDYKNSNSPYQNSDDFHNTPQVPSFHNALTGFHENAENTENPHLITPTGSSLPFSNVQSESTLIEHVHNNIDYPHTIPNDVEPMPHPFCAPEVLVEAHSLEQLPTKQEASPVSLQDPCGGSNAEAESNIQTYPVEAEHQVEKENQEYKHEGYHASSYEKPSNGDPYASIDTENVHASNMHADEAEIHGEVLDHSLSSPTQSINAQTTSVNLSSTNDHPWNETVYADLKSCIACHNKSNSLISKNTTDSIRSLLHNITLIDDDTQAGKVEHFNDNFHLDDTLHRAKNDSTLTNSIDNLYNQIEEVQQNLSSSALLNVGEVRKGQPKHILNNNANKEQQTKTDDSLDDNDEILKNIHNFLKKVERETKHMVVIPVQEENRPTKPPDEQNTSVKDNVVESQRNKSNYQDGEVNKIPSNDPSKNTDDVINVTDNNKDSTAVSVKQSKHKNLSELLWRFAKLKENILQMIEQNSGDASSLIGKTLKKTNSVVGSDPYTQLGNSDAAKFVSDGNGHIEETHAIVDAPMQNGMIHGVVGEQDTPTENEIPFETFKRSNNGLNDPYSDIGSSTHSNTKAGIKASDPRFGLIKNMAENTKRSKFKKFMIIKHHATPKKLKTSPSATSHSKSTATKTSPSATSHRKRTATKTSPSATSHSKSTATKTSPAATSHRKRTETKSLPSATSHRKRMATKGNQQLRYKADKIKTHRKSNSLIIGHVSDDVR